MEVDIGLESIPSQIGTAVLELLDGRIVRATGQILDSEDGKAACGTLYKILQVLAMIFSL